MMGTMAIMGTEGDVKLEWNPDDPEDVRKARETFDTLKKKGFMAFSVKAGGKKGALLPEFDPHVASIVMVPAVAGG